MCDPRDRKPDSRLPDVDEQFNSGLGELDIALAARANRILAAVPGDVLERLIPQLEGVMLGTGEMLHNGEGSVAHVHFPTTALISAFVATPSGTSAEVALIGNDGALGIMAVLCGVPGPFRCMVDRGGHAYRINLLALQKELTIGSPFQQILMRYLMTRMIQMATNSLCNGHHSVEQRLCRALLMRLDRLDSDTLLLTHESAANILGVRRAGVTEAAAHLRNAGAITYARGRIAVIDRTILEQRACECYQSAKAQTARFESALGTSS